MQLQNVKGTRDFVGEDAILREKVVSILKRVFEKYGFQPFYTPILEYAEVLKTKISDEMLGLIYEFKDKAGRDIGLRYDLTLGLARVAASQDLRMPFKRYQIERAWRYEAPQKGRYREFWQADIDILGVQGVEAEAEYLACISECLEALGFKNFVIRVNSRKLLDQVASECKIKNPEKVYQLIDKADKIGIKEVEKQLGKLSDNSLEFLKIIKSDKAKKFSSFDEIEKLLELSKSYNISKKIKFDAFLVRGLAYYTGLVFEIVLQDKNGISIAGGGRYDDLAEKLGGKPIPATGISIGVDRICELLKEKEKQVARTITQVYVIPISDEFTKEAIKILQKLRDKGIKADIAFSKLTKSLEYANKQGIPYVAIIGKEEIKTKKIKLKDMNSGVEKLMSLEEVAKKLLE